MVDTQFQSPGPLVDGELTLVLRQTTNADSSMGLVPAYRFDMMLTQTGERVGNIDLRLGDSDFLIRYAGQIGYGVDLPFRGNRFAARSVRLLIPLATSHGMMPLWITCNPENWPSRKSCEIAGGTLAEIVDLPTDCEMYRRGERRKCRYRFDA